MSIRTPNYKKIWGQLFCIPKNTCSPPPHTHQRLSLYGTRSQMLIDCYSENLSNPITKKLIILWVADNFPFMLLFYKQVEWEQWTKLSFNSFTACMYSVVQLCSTLCNPMDCSPPVFSVHGIFWARILEWFVIPFSRGSSRPRDWTWVSCISCIGKKILYHWATFITYSFDYSIFSEVKSKHRSVNFW